MNVGDVAPSFTLYDQSNQLHSLEGILKEGPMALFFYPRALTPRCTKESCHFRDLTEEFRELGAQIVGISPDHVSRQARFAEEHRLPFPLLSDPDRSTAKSYNVSRGPAPIPLKRTTFVIDRHGLIRMVLQSQSDVNSHADQALIHLRRFV